ncbi:MAG: hypothetical protein ACK4IX_14050, partial [Candidatus Sericytochromatia bacterium]
AASVIKEVLNNDDENTIFGAVIDERVQGEIIITVIATGSTLGGGRRPHQQAQQGRVHDGSQPSKSLLDILSQEPGMQQAYQQPNYQQPNYQQPQSMNPNDFSAVKPQINDGTNVPHFLRERDQWGKK